MGKFPQFSLTNKVISEADLYDLDCRSSPLPTSFDGWVSGDYSAATDGLAMWASKEVLNALLLKQKCIPELGLEALWNVLGPHIISYPSVQRPDKSYYPSIDTFLQKNGQLMGSVLSFPILCLINLITYWVCLERFLGQKFELHQLPVLINGDDILFKASPEFYQLWLDTLHHVGFSPSLGKNYYHKKYLTVNSVAYLYRDGSFHEVPMFNVGLLIGQSKCCQRKKDGLLPIWDMYNRVLAGSRDKLRAHCRFLHYHSRQIDALTHRGEYSLFACHELGGLGFRHYEEVPRYFTQFQRRFGRYLEGLYNQTYEGELDSLAPWCGLVRRASLPLRGVPLNKPKPSGIFSTWPSTTPLPCYAVEVREPMKTIPSSCLQVAPSERPDDFRQDDLIVKRVDRGILKGFRSNLASLKPLSNRRLEVYSRRVVRLRYGVNPKEGELIYFLDQTPLRLTKSVFSAQIRDLPSSLLEGWVAEDLIEPTEHGLIPGQGLDVYSVDTPTRGDSMEARDCTVGTL
jgi:hypothetical protein